MKGQWRSGRGDPPPSQSSDWKGSEERAVREAEEEEGAELGPHSESGPSPKARSHRGALSKGAGAELSQRRSLGRWGPARSERLKEVREQNGPRGRPPRGVDRWSPGPARRAQQHTLLCWTLQGGRLTRTRREGEGRLKNHCQISGLDIG